MVGGISGTNLAWVEGDGGDGVKMALEAFPQGKPLHGRRLEREVQERVFHLRRAQRGRVQSDEKTATSSRADPA